MYIEYLPYLVPRGTFAPGDGREESVIGSSVPRGTLQDGQDFAGMDSSIFGPSVPRGTGELRVKNVAKRSH